MQNLKKFTVVESGGVGAGGGGGGEHKRSSPAAVRSVEPTPADPDAEEGATGRASDTGATDAEPAEEAAATATAASASASGSAAANRPSSSSPPPLALSEAQQQLPAYLLFAISTTVQDRIVRRADLNWFSQNLETLFKQVLSGLHSIASAMRVSCSRFTLECFTPTHSNSISLSLVLRSLSAVQ